MNVARHSSLLFHSSTKTAKDIETTTVPRVGFTAVGQEAAADFNSRPVLEKDVILCCFAPKGGFYFQCADGSAIWSNLPPSLHQKLYKRNQNLPRLISLSVSDTQDWLVIFQDGSFATSGFSLSPKLRSCLANDDSTPILFKFGPHQAWVLVRADGTVESERLPTGLDMLLKRRSKFDAPIKDLQINSFGGKCRLHYNQLVIRLVLAFPGWRIRMGVYPANMRKAAHLQSEKTETSRSLCYGLVFK